ncbi:hypothetical protein Micbo1qcDRAFT_169548, partial [Microdochium bolleyi]
MDDNEIDSLRRQLREAQKRADDASREKEVQQQRAESERRRAESERRRAESERRRAAEASREGEIQRQRAESERQRADSERQRADSERQRAEDAAAQSQQTTLPGYITNCHRYLDLNVAVESDKSLTTKGSITNPQDKLVPRTLKPWTDFLEQQRSIHGRLYSVFPVDKQVFESIKFLEELGGRLARKKIANERDLEYVQHNIVETPVANIVESLRDHDATKQSFSLGLGLTFDNHPNVLSDGADEPMQRRAVHDSNQLRADQVCVYRHDDVGGTQRSLAFVVEYKPPHKLTLP